MRARVIFPAGALAALVLAFAIHYRFASKPVVAAGEPQPQAAAPAPAAPSEPPRKLWAVTSHSTEDVPPSEVVEADNHGIDDPVQARIAQLADLGASTDPASLKVIVSELNDGNAQIRKAAVDAAVQFGSPEAIPSLRNQLNYTDDAREKMEIQEAIDFLQLPAAESVVGEGTNDAPGN